MSAPSRGLDPVDTRSLQQGDDLRGVEASLGAAGWKIEYRQLDTGPAVSDSVESVLDEVSLLFERHGAPIECIGESPRGAVTLVVPERPGHVVLNGRSLLEGEIGVLGPGAELHAVTRDAESAWNVHIPVERFLADREALGVGTGGFRADRAQFRVAKGRIGPSALSTLPPCTEARLTRLATAEIAGTLIQEAVASLARVPPASERALCTQREIRVARDYIHAHLAEPIRIPELCAAAGVRQRTLERRFRSTYGMTLKGYVRACRLHAVHRTLTDPMGCDEFVTDVALRFGFTHLGRFAGAYREFFGCLPHEARKASLRRPLTTSG